jgi:hypothetical protein
MNKGIETIIGPPYIRRAIRRKEDLMNKGIETHSVAVINIGRMQSISVGKKT